jgi:predicted porin
MFKKLALAAAIGAVFSTSAFAQSSVTLYGRLNTTVERIKIKPSGAASESRTDMNNNASRIGFRGTEDLGGGLKANFTIEHGFDSDTGAQSGDRFWGREAWVGLSGGFGAVRLGNLPASEAYFATADYVSLHNHDTGKSSDAFYAHGFRIATGKMSNSIDYTTPSFGGLKLTAQLGVDDGEGDRRQVVAANYDNGGLHVGAGYEAFNGMKSFSLSGLYSLGAFTFGGYFERNSGKVESGTLVDLPTGFDTKRNNIRLVGMLALGNGEIHANYGMAGKIADIPDSKANQFTLGYNYNLSKRTKVYTYYTKLDEKPNVEGFYSPYGADFDSFALGLRHNF